MAVQALRRLYVSQMKAPVVGGEHLQGLCGGAVQFPAVVSEQHEGQRTLAKEMSGDLQFGQGIPELADDGSGAFIDQHLFGSRLRAEVVHHRDAAIVVMAPAGLEIAAHPIVAETLPFETGNELAGHGVQVLEHVRERRARRFLHREHLDAGLADLQMGPKALDGRIGDEEIEMGVVRQAGGLGDDGVVVHEAPKEAEHLRLRQGPRSDRVGEMHLERPRLLMELPDGAGQILFKPRHDGAGRQPGPQGRAWVAPRALDTRSQPCRLREALEHEHEDTPPSRTARRPARSNGLPAPAPPGR